MQETRTLEEEFQQVKEATILEFEEELDLLRKRRRDEKRESLERVKRFHGYLQEAIDKSGIDVDIFGKLGKYHEEEAELLQEYLAKLRDDLMKGDPEVINRAYRQWNFNLARLQNVEKRQQAYCIDAYVVANKEVLEELKKTNGYQEPPPGVKQNPSANSIEPRWLKLKAVHTGVGSGMGAYGKPFPLWGFFHFYYVPPADTGILTATVNMFYYGYWLVKANDGCWDNKDASASLDVWLRWSQGPYVSNWTKQPFMWAAGDNIHFYKVHVGEIDSYSRQIGPLLGGHTVWITVAVGLQVDARGGGSHAEINYSDGTGRSIWAMSMFVG